MNCLAQAVSLGDVRLQGCERDTEVLGDVHGRNELAEVLEPVRCLLNFGSGQTLLGQDRVEFAGKILILLEQLAGRFLTACRTFGRAYWPRRCTMRSCPNSTGVLSGKLVR